MSSCIHNRVKSSSDASWCHDCGARWPVPEGGDLYERLAAIQHDIWAHWMRYLLGPKTYPVTQEPTGRGIREADVQHWLRQIDTPYAELSEVEKASDREQVDRFWPLLVDHARATAFAPSVATPPQEGEGERCPYYAGTGDRKCRSGCSTEPRCITDEHYEQDFGGTTS